MNPELLELICEGIAIGVCPIADDDDLKELLDVLEELDKEKAPTPPEPLPFRIPPTDAPRPPADAPRLVKTRRGRRA